jgi:hypothetical protein
MNVMPTLEGGLRIDAENPIDWELLLAVLQDAKSCESDLAARLAGMMPPEETPEWEELVVPDLRENFDSQLDLVARTVSEARQSACEGTGSLWIHRADGAAWYGALNQARLALEERFQFGPAVNVDPKAWTVAKRAAFHRSRFYQTIQGLLLEFVMA